MMSQEEKLKMVIGEAARGLSRTTWRVEMEGTGGLALFLLVKEDGAGSGQERAYLQLRSKDNQNLAMAMTNAHETGALKEAKVLEAEMAGLVERLVLGDEFNMPMAVILARRAEEARRHLNDLRRAADQVPQAMVWAAEAGTAAAWVDRMAKEEEPPAL